MSTTPDVSPTESPLVRSTLWFSLQVIIQAFFLFWLGYRATGYKRLEKEQGALILANHQSFLDPIAVGLPFRRPMSFVARDSLFRVSWLAWLMRQTHVISINQQAASTTSMRDIIRRLHDGWLVTLFPEGTRSETGAIGEIKPGFAAIVRRAKMPVYPVGISGAYQALPLGGWFLKPTRVRVVFGEPLTIEDIARYSHRDQEAELVELVRFRIAACCEAADAWRETGTPPRPPSVDV